MSNINIEELKNNLEERQEAVRTDFLSELEIKRNEISKQIEQKDESITNIKDEIKVKLEGYKNHRSLTSGPKVLDEKVYKVLNSVAKDYLAQAREKRRILKRIENEKAELQAEFDGLNEETLKDELDQRQEVVKTQFISELKTKQEELKEQIKQKQDEIKAEQNEYAETIAIKSAYESIKGIKHLEAKTYESANKKAVAYFMKARKINYKMKKLEQQVAETQKDFEDLDSYIQELIFGRKEDIVKQEDEMWKAYREEQEKTKEQQEDEMWKEHDAKIVKEQEDEMWEEYRSENNTTNNRRKLEEILAWKQHERKEKYEMDQIEKQTEEEIKIYNDEEDKKEQEKSNKSKKQEETEKGLDEKDFEDILKIFEKRDKNQASMNKGNVRTNPKPEKKFSVNQINFGLKNGEPVYSVVINTADNSQEHSIIGWDNIARKRGIQYLKKIINFNKNAYRCYDLNIERILRKIDLHYGTDALKQYIKLMQASSMEEIEAIDFKIDYDFSNLNISPKGLKNKSKLANMKKLAKTNAKLGKASYEKEPNFLKRLYSRIKSLKLDSQDANQKNYNAEYMERLMESRETYQSTDESIREALISGMDDPEFNFEDVAEFYGKTPEEINKYIKEIENMQSKNKSKLWREKYEVSEEKLQPKLENEKEQNNKQDKEMQH